MIFRRRTKAPVLVLPMKSSEDPIRGYKHAYVGLNMDLTRATFMATTGRRCYWAEQYAQCLGGKLDQPHGVPDINCTCGFYAVKDRDRLFASGPLVLLAVDLHGKVVEYKRGYRAEYQRVIAATLTDTCCHAGCWNEYEYLARPESNYAWASAAFLCRKHRRVLGNSYTSNVDVLDTLGTETWTVSEVEQLRLTIFDYDPDEGVRLTWNRTDQPVEYSDGAA